MSRHRETIRSGTIATAEVGSVTAAEVGSVAAAFIPTKRLLARNESSQAMAHPKPRAIPSKWLRPVIGHA